MSTTPTGRGARERVGAWRRNPVVDLVVTLAFAALIAYVVQLWIVKPYRIPSGSMIPTFEISDRIIAARFWYRLEDPARNDIIVFHPNGRGDEALPVDEVADTTFVKRLIGLPGEWIGATGDRVYVCDRRAPDTTRPIEETAGCRFLDEPYVSSPQEPFGPEKIPDDRYFMMGDNRAFSNDSRSWGPVGRDQLIGRAFMIYWPVTRIRFF